MITQSIYMLNEGMNIEAVAPVGGWTNKQVVAIGGPADDKVVGVALNAAAAGQIAIVCTEGRWILPKNTGAGEAMAQGQLVYFDPATNKLTTAADDGGSPAVAHPKAGRVWVAAIGADALVQVKLGHF